MSYLATQMRGEIEQKSEKKNEKKTFKSRISVKLFLEVFHEKEQGHHFYPAQPKPEQ